jgi:uncharacterized protein YgiM (DUF1202 family)
MGANPGGPPAPPLTTARRARRRRWRRALGVLAFSVAAVAIATFAFQQIAGPGSRHESAGSSPPTTVVTTLPPAGPYKVTDGLNVRTGPGRSFPAVGTIDLGKEVMVACVIDGEMVDGPSGPTNKWLLVTSANVAGYVTSQYVATGAAVNDPAVIPRCSGV